MKTFNGLTAEQTATIRKATKYLICCGIDAKTAHAIARAQVIGGIIKTEA